MWYFESAHAGNVLAVLATFGGFLGTLLNLRGIRSSISRALDAVSTFDAALKVETASSLLEELRTEVEAGNWNHALRRRGPLERLVSELQAHLPAQRSLAWVRSDLERSFSVLRKASLAPDAACVIENQSENLTKTLGHLHAVRATLRVTGPHQVTK
jgi:HAMP domain-containing protein